MTANLNDQSRGTAARWRLRVWGVVRRAMFAALVVAIVIVILAILYAVLSLVLVHYGIV